MPVVDLTWFEPLPKQREFIGGQWTAGDEPGDLEIHHPEDIYAGGVGSGKTLSGSFKALKASVDFPGTVGLVGRQTYGALRDTTQKVMLDGDDKPAVIPRELVRHFDAEANTLYLWNGSEILFRSFQDHNIEKLLSLNLGWFYVDEATETTENVWLTLLGRLRHPNGPRVGWGTTNPNGHDWVWRRMHPDSEDRAGETRLLIAPSEENMHLAEDYVRRLRRMPKEWQRRFVDASFDTAAGMIWDNFVRQVHVVPPFDVPVDWRKIEGLDHGRRNPTAVLEASVDRDGFVLIHDGYYSPGLVQDHVAGVKAMRERVIPGHARGWSPVVADPSIYARGWDGSSPADEYQRLGLSLVKGNNNVAAGLLRVSEMFERDADADFPAWHPWAGTRGPDGLGAPRLFIMETPWSSDDPSSGTKQLLIELPDYRWKDLSPAQEEKVDQPEEPRKLRDHACDALRYLCMALPWSVRTTQRRPQEHPESVHLLTRGIIDKRF